MEQGKKDLPPKWLKNQSQLKSPWSKQKLDNFQRTVSKVNIWNNTWSSLLYGKTGYAAKRTLHYDAIVQDTVEVLKKKKKTKKDKLVENYPNGS